MTVSEIARVLSESGIPSHDAPAEARILVSHFTGISVSRLLAEPDADFCSEELISAVKKRAERYPLQYILGKWEFYGMTFEVTRDTLIPRPDTEIIAEEAIKRCRVGGHVLDLCTGTGCIAAAILANVADSRCVAVDLYPDTLAVARRNIARHGLSGRCELICGDATADLFPADVKFDVIVSNPPYVTSSEMEELEPELMYEPSVALTDGGDGLSIISKIIEVYKNHLTAGGFMIIEHGYRQSKSVCGIAIEHGMSYSVISDYGGNTRGVVLGVSSNVR